MPQNPVFKTRVPPHLLYDFLDKCTSHSNGYYAFNVDSYRKAKYFQYDTDLCKELEEYYYPSKRYYVKRELKYSRFVTIIRHICNYNGIPFTTNIRYANNTYFITYYIKNEAVVFATPHTTPPSTPTPPPPKKPRTALTS